MGLAPPIRRRYVSSKTRLVDRQRLKVRPRHCFPQLSDGQCVSVGSMELGVGEYTRILLQMCRVWDEAPVNPIDSSIADHGKIMEKSSPFGAALGLAKSDETPIKLQAQRGSRRWLCPRMNQGWYHQKKSSRPFHSTLETILPGTTAPNEMWGLWTRHVA